MNHPAHDLGIAPKLTSKPVIGDYAIGIGKCEPARAASQRCARTFRAGDADVSRCCTYGFGSAGTGQRRSRVAATVGNHKRLDDVACQLRVLCSPNYRLNARDDGRGFVMGRDDHADQFGSPMKLQSASACELRADEIRQASGMPKLAIASVQERAMRRPSVCCPSSRRSAAICQSR
jgi:hypothetical protein